MLVPEAAFPAALVALPDGDLLYGERLTGRIRRVAPDGSVARDAVATVDVQASIDDQRGLLGLAGADGRVFAAWTRSSDGRLVVAQVVPGDPRLIWEGPVSEDRANGGHLEVSPDGLVVIGIGDLLDRSRVDDPDTPNGKLLSLDPDLPPDQTPGVLSSGWNNPYAFTFVGDVPWVVDNAAPGEAERIGRGDRPASEAQALPEPQEAPSVLVVLDDDRLGLCGFLSSRMVVVELVDDTVEITDEVAAEPCSTGATVLDDGRVVTATPDEVRVGSG